MTEAGTIFTLSPESAGGQCGVGESVLSILYNKDEMKRKLALFHVGISPQMSHENMQLPTQSVVF